MTSIYPESQQPIRKTSELLPNVFRTETNNKFFSAIVDPLIQPGVLQKLSGYIGQRYGKTYQGKDLYLDDNNTLRSRYQLEPGVVITDQNNNVDSFYDYIDFKNQLKLLNNLTERDDILTEQEHYSWNPPIDWDKFINYREYYWIPDGPPPVNIEGNLSAIESSYIVKSGLNSFIFSPNGYTNNPSITLYRGQTYHFNVSLDPSDGMLIKSVVDTGSIIYKPVLSYNVGDVVVYNNALYKALVYIPMNGLRLTIDLSQWGLVNHIDQNNPLTKLEYNTGVTNNGANKGVITFTVPYDAPDLLFYQSILNPDAYGQFIINNINSNRSIDVDKSIIGKPSYKSSNGIEFTNGLFVRFIDNVTPAIYAKDTWVVEGVGTGISLTNIKNLIVPILTTDNPVVLFNNGGFDSLPFNSARMYPGTPDYITIARDSADLNAWSRYNRWFHIDVLNISHLANGTAFDAAASKRATRPIIEFKRNLQLYNYGSLAIGTVDFVDTKTTDVLSIIEGSLGYLIDGEQVFDGATVLVVNDTDKMTNNKIYKISFINFSGNANTELNYSKQIHLTELIPSNAGDCVLIKRGTNNAGRMFHYNGTSWVESQEKTTVNQEPLFDAFDISGDSFSSYNQSTFLGTKIIGYKVGTGTADTQLGFPIEYLNIDNVGDILFNWYWDTDKFSYINNNTPVSVSLHSGYYRYNADIAYKSQIQINSATSDTIIINSTTGTLTTTDFTNINWAEINDISNYTINIYRNNKLEKDVSIKNSSITFSVLLNKNDIVTLQLLSKDSKVTLSLPNESFSNGWILTDNTYIQPLIDSQVISTSTNTLTFNTIDWSTSTKYALNFYLNGKLIGDPISSNNGTFEFSETFNVGDTVSLKLISDNIPVHGYYSIPLGLERNPFNDTLTQFTLGEFVDHVQTSVEFNKTDFNGVVPGVSNLKDLYNYQQYASRFMKHAGIAAISISMLCDHTTDITDALSHARDAYEQYKSLIISTAMQLQYNKDMPSFFDDIILNITKNRSYISAFANSDMIGSGAYTKLQYLVDDISTTTFTLSSNFNLDTLSSNAVYVYITRNNVKSQLLYSQDYHFNSTFGFIIISYALELNDLVEIREYSSTGVNYIPPTPTSLGLYKKYKPEMYFDTSYVTDTGGYNVIRGHDGSITVAYGDFRDQVLLEFEYRIYNNIKQVYNPDVFDNDMVLGGYNGIGLYAKPDIDNILSRQFHKWANLHNLDYSQNNEQELEFFTFNYNKATDFTQTKSVPGYWKGIYLWYYDTYRPDIAPWEMLGFSEKPDWWETEYGPAPYTNGNLIMWTDLQNGVIKHGARAGTHIRYTRPDLLSHLPVDNSGNLLDPLTSGAVILANYQNYQQVGDPFVFGDIAPTEYAWRTSSSYPFAIISALCTLRPFDFISSSFDKTLTKRNLLGQIVNVSTNTFVTLNDIIVPQIGSTTTVGLVNYLVDYKISQGGSYLDIANRINNIDVKLSSRMSGFIDTEQQEFILDSKNPSSTSNNIFIPKENYQVIFNVSTPVLSITYSGIIIERTPAGWQISGYDSENPYFNYYEAIPSISDYTISVGGTTEPIANWAPDVTYLNGQLVTYQNKIYRSLKTQTSSVFQSVNWVFLPKAPVLDAVTASHRSKFNTNILSTLKYRTILKSDQDVVDFILGYAEYLKSVGFSFKSYNAELQATEDWSTSASEFLFWASQRWATSSLIALSPGAKQINITSTAGVALSLIDGEFTYSVYSGNGTILPLDQISVNRTFRNLTISTIDNAIGGIYFVKLYYVLKENIVLFSGKTAFNDILYEKSTGYRQGRIKSICYRTTDWDGDYTSPGFIFDDVNITAWKPYIDYQLGDIVSYQSHYWASLKNQLGTGLFNSGNWTKIDSVPSKQLVPNYDYSIKLFEGYYDATSEGPGELQREFARHAIGYQNREYLQNIAPDAITQFQLYQGFIKEKGSINAINKVFDKLSRYGDESIVINEDWAFEVGQLGGTNQFNEVEISITKNNFVVNPQPLVFTNNTVPTQYYQISNSDFLLGLDPFTYDIIPTTTDSIKVKTCGYSRTDQIDFTVTKFTDIVNLDITKFTENDNILITFYNNEWTILRFNVVPHIRVINVDISNNILTFNQQHNYQVGDIIGVISGIPGFYQINSIPSSTSVIIDVKAPLPNIVNIKVKYTTFDQSIAYPKDSVVIDPSGILWRAVSDQQIGSVLSYPNWLIVYNPIDLPVAHFTTARCPSYDSIDQQNFALLTDGAKLWVDNNGSDNWEVIKKHNQYINYKLNPPVINLYPFFDPTIHYDIYSIVIDNNNTVWQAQQDIPSKGTLSSPAWLVLSNVRTVACNNIGTAIVYDSNNNQILVSCSTLTNSNPGIISVYKYNRTSSTLIYSISAPANINYNSSFGYSMAISPDSKFLIVGAPNAIGQSNYRGPFVTTYNYSVGDIVFYENTTWECIKDVHSDDSTNSMYSSHWKRCSIILGNTNGRSIVPINAQSGQFTNQGLIFVYTYDQINGNWKYLSTIISPRPAANEFFGTSISISMKNGIYNLSVSAPGSNTNSGRVYQFVYSGTWSQIENIKYAGIYQPNTRYLINSIVWYNNNLYTANVNIDATSSSFDNTKWNLYYSTISTQSSLPQYNAITTIDQLSTGLITNNQLVEFVNSGDMFGSSIASNATGEILIVSAPFSNNLYVANYKGIWKSYITYPANSVVYYNNNYYQSSTGGLNNIGLWTVVSSTNINSGKVFVYIKSANSYNLIQTIDSSTLNVPSTSSDNFGYDVEIDQSGTVLLISSWKSNNYVLDQGSVYLFRGNITKDTSGNIINVVYNFSQLLESFERMPNEQFGQSMSISNDTNTIVISSKNATYIINTLFESNGTTFDHSSTSFSDHPKGYPGGVYVFEKKENTYFLSEKIQPAFDITNNTVSNESFGYNVITVPNGIVVGSPTYVDINVTDNNVGIVRIFEKNTATWNVISSQSPSVDIRKIKSISLYDAIRNVKIQDLDYVDFAKLKILNYAEQELKYKLLFDPAIYSIGTPAQTVDQSQVWGKKQIGSLWWDLSTVKWYDYEQNDISYTIGNWNQLAAGSSIDIYEWVESTLLPSEWASLADTPAGISQNISGQPLYPNDNVYVIKEFYNTNTGQLTNILYYYWVRNKVSVPNIPGRRISAADVAFSIQNPIGTGTAFVALCGSNLISLYNVNTIMSDKSLLDIQIFNSNSRLNPVHKEYQLISKGSANSTPTLQLETKWIDSLIGFDKIGNRVPDDRLPIKQQYGIKFRPRQSMFINRPLVLQSTIEYVNSILMKEPFADTINYEYLNLKDNPPDVLLNLYDLSVDTYEELQQLTITRIKQAKLSVTIDPDTNKLSSVTIVDPGLGYIPGASSSTTDYQYNGPPVTLVGDGINGQISVKIDLYGRLVDAKIVNPGSNYSEATATIRQYSVLVLSDSTYNNNWSIYSWDDTESLFYRSLSQGFDTTQYWNYVDWWADGYSSLSTIAYEIPSVADYGTISNINQGQLIRIKEYNRGGWAIFKNIKSINISDYYNTTFIINNFESYYVLVGQQNGTIAFSESLYNLSIKGIGYDDTIGYDKTPYDIDNAIELRNIFNAIKTNIFVGTYAVEWNNLFFLGVKMAHAEQMYVDWAFKTSLLTAVHNIGPFIQPNNYTNDNIKYFQDYINEVKPFRSTVREYVSRYNTIESANNGISDFDMPPAYFPNAGKTLPVTKLNVQSNSDPWLQWTNNNTFSIVNINVYNGGSGYTYPPLVNIQGDGIGASAIAYISNGSVNAVRIISSGSGFTSVPKITLVGGNGTNNNNATAYAVIGNTKARTFNITMKFDRTSQSGLFSDYTFTDTFIGTGYTMGFVLSYMPSYNMSSLSITKNGILVLGTDYTISITKSKSTITMKQAPAIGDKLVVVYDLNDSLLDSVNRIQKFYTPVAGMIGNDLNQLMSGIDFGGVQVQGTTFEVSSGWDVLPWDTDTWDSATDNTDYYVMCSNNTTSISLPYIPLDGQRFTLYLQKSGSNSQTLVTVLNQNFDINLPVSDINPQSLVLSFYGDGSTSVLDFSHYIQIMNVTINSGDMLIIRTDDSDGTKTINDVNLLDTNLSGGSLQQINNAFSSASGMSPEDIIVDGSDFVNPIQIPATEENIPGQVLDSLSIKVFTGVLVGPSPMYTNVYIGDGSTSIYNIAFPITSIESCLVFIDGILTTNYNIDFNTNQILLSNTPTANSKIEITTFGVGGSGIIDQKTFIAKSGKSKFLTSAKYTDTNKNLTYVTVNGLPVENTTFTSSEPNNKGVMTFTLANKPQRGDLISVICLSNKLNSVMYNVINQQHIVDVAGTVNIPVSRSQLTNVDISSCLVLVNNVALEGPETIVVIYNGTNNIIRVGLNPHVQSNSIIDQNISVLLNGKLLTYLIDYTYNFNLQQITVIASLNINDVIKVENNYNSKYLIVNNNLTINNLSIGDIVDIFWFSGDNTSQIITTDYTGGQPLYILQLVPIDISYVWVFVNGIKLTANIDFYMLPNSSAVNFYKPTTNTDIVKIITFGSKVHVLAHGYEIHKDMLNKYHYLRYSTGTCFLASDLNYFDQQIVVTDGSLLSQPYPMRNIPGIIMIGGERIEYFQISGNILSQLRRGVNGTGIGTIYTAGSDVINLSYSEVIPYTENQQRTDIQSTAGISEIAVSFLPLKSSRVNWVRQTIPSNFGPCDVVEVFVGGRRLRKDPIQIIDKLNPKTPITLEAEFSVDGINNSIRLTNPINEAGINISVIRRTGRVWYNGSLTDGTSEISKFILKRSTTLPS